jgi:hypothetical protein
VDGGVAPHCYYIPIEAVNVFLGERQRRRFDEQHARLSSGG